MQFVNWLKSFIFSNAMNKSDLHSEIALSHNKLELFLKCKRCFYFQYKRGIKLPTLGGSFALNNAVDAFLKKEFDRYRVEQKKHDFCIKNGINVVPFKHPNFKSWRDNRQGIQYSIPSSNITVTGRLDDFWFDIKSRKLIVVEYKTTSRKKKVASEVELSLRYKRQVEIYQWLLRKNGFQVSKLSYFVFCNAKKDLDAFKCRLNFDISIIPYQGNDSWVESKIRAAG